MENGLWRLYPAKYRQRDLDTCGLGYELAISQGRAPTEENGEYYGETPQECVPVLEAIVLRRIGC
jgi:hypothetical protein